MRVFKIFRERILNFKKSLVENLEFFRILRSENFAIRNAELLIFAPKLKINSFSFMRSYIKIFAYFLKASKTPKAYSVRLSFLTI